MKNGRHWEKQKTGRVPEKILTRQAEAGNPGAAKVPQLVKCDGCHQNTATTHVTVNVECFSVTETGTSVRMKQSFFWLCEDCNAKMKVFLTRDDQQPRRVAKALTPIPFYWIEARQAREAEKGSGPNQTR